MEPVISFFYRKALKRDTGSIIQVDNMQFVYNMELNWIYLCVPRVHKSYLLMLISTKVHYNPISSYVKRSTQFHV
jgi:hypothetical protein